MLPDSFLGFFPPTAGDSIWTWISFYAFFGIANQATRMKHAENCHGNYHYATLQGDGIPLVRD